MGKRLIRKLSITVFAFGESYTEKAFLKHIRATYGRNTGITNTIDCANGGSPKSIIDTALRHNCLAYDRKFILLDADVLWPKKVKDKAAEHSIKLIPATPCLEGFILSLLEVRTNFTGYGSNKCKRIFEKKYLNKVDKLDFRNYKKILPISKLEALRKVNPILDTIICLMTSTEKRNGVIHR